MHGYRDHCIRSAYPRAPQLYCPYSVYEVPCPFCEYRQKVEEYPAHFHKRPTNPPPIYIPKPPTPARPISTITLTPCAYKYTYLWLRNKEGFWAYIVTIGKKSISGWRYTGNRWKQFNSRFKDIINFTCS